MKRTPQRLVGLIYSNQKKSSKVRGHAAPSYTQQELYEWVTNQPNFEALYDAWVSSGYDRLLAPSCDRLRNSEGYSLGNLRLVDFYTNAVVGRLKPIAQYDMEDILVTTFTSLKEASEVTGINRSRISGFISGNFKNAGGFKWRYL